MKKKAKKKLLKQVMDEVMNGYDFSQPVNIPIEKLTGIEDQVPSKGIQNLTKTAEYIDNFYSNNLFDTVDEEIAKEISDAIYKDYYSVFIELQKRFKELEEKEQY